MVLNSLGKITVAVGGTPVQATSKYTPVHSILVQALSSNTGKVFIGNTQSMSKVGAMPGVVAVLAIPTANLIPSFTATVSYAPGALSVAELWLDVDVNGEGVLVSFLQA